MYNYHHIDCKTPWLKGTGKVIMNRVKSELKFEFFQNGDIMHIHRVGEKWGESERERASLETKGKPT